MGKILFALITFACFAIVDYYFSYYTHTQRIPRIIEAFENGGEADIPFEFIDRPEVIASIKQMILRPEKTFVYYLIVGEHGVGKTTALKLVTKQIFDDTK